MTAAVNLELRGVSLLNNAVKLGHLVSSCPGQSLWWLLILHPNPRFKNNMVASLRQIIENNATGTKFPEWFWLLTNLRRICPRHRIHKNGILFPSKVFLSLFFSFSNFLLGIFFIYISNATPKVPYTLPLPCSPTHPFLLPGSDIPLYWGIDPSQDDGLMAIDS